MSSTERADSTGKTARRESTRIELNKTNVDKLTEPGEYLDTKLPGFKLVVFPAKVMANGTVKQVKTYQAHARVKGGPSDGKFVRHTIGRHGAPWNATDARAAANTALLKMKEGHWIKREQKELKAQSEQKALQDAVAATVEQARSALTLKAAFDAWEKDSTDVKQSSKDLFRIVIFKHLRDWLDTPLADITPSMVVDRYSEVAQSTVSSALSAFRALRLLFNWVIVKQEVDYQDPEKRFITMNPVQALSRRKKWKKLAPRQNYIKNGDLKKWFEAVQSLNNSTVRDYFVFVLLTGLRRREASTLQWPDVDFDAQVLVCRDTKNGKDHRLPISGYVLELLQRRAQESKSRFIFPSRGDRPIDDAIDRRQQEIVELTNIEFTVHSLRRTFSYAAARLDISDSKRKALLNHSQTGDITEEHYTPWHVEDLREPMSFIQKELLFACGVRAKRVRQK